MTASLFKFFARDLLFPFCALIWHGSVLTLSFSRGTPFAGVGHHLLTNLVFPLDWLRLSAIGAPTPFSSIWPCPEQFAFIPPIRFVTPSYDITHHILTLTNTSTPPFLGLDRWFWSIRLISLLCNSLVCYLRRIYTFNKLSGCKTTSVCCGVQVNINLY